MNIIEELNKLRLEHYICNDNNFYSCELIYRVDLVHNPEIISECNCGADEHNKKLDKIIEYLTQVRKKLN